MNFLAILVFSALVAFFSYQIGVGVGLKSDDGLSKLMLKGQCKNQLLIERGGWGCRGSCCRNPRH